ncbi:hypothetical protein NX89_05095 [Neisseria meningitidis]|nr:hypothetical protein NX89_05095 [Neisseria meningitidis]
MQGLNPAAAAYRRADYPFPRGFGRAVFLLPVPSEGGSGFLRGHSRLSLFPPLSVIPAKAGIPKPLPPSFPRRRESSPFGFSRFR